MIDLKKRAVSMAAIALLTTPVMTAPILHAPYVLAEETEASNSTNEKTTTAEAIEETTEKTSGSVSEVVKKESQVLPDSSVFHIQIGYEFEDGSFDTWASGTAFLVSNQELLTTQSLADTSTTSTLYKTILDKKGDAYKTAGIDLKNESEVEDHFVIKVTNSDGKLLSVKGSSVKNGLGLISLEKTVVSTAAVFEEEDSVETKEGTKYKLKLASYENETSSIFETEGTLVKPAANAVGGTLSMTADSSKGDVVGSPIYSDNGFIIGMVSGNGENLTVVPTNGLQNFLTSQSVKYDTRLSFEKKQEQESKEQEAKAIEDANKASVKTSALKKAIKKAEAIDSSEYKKESFEKMSLVLTESKALLENDDKSQAEVDALTKELEDSYSNLEKLTFIDKYLIFIVGGVVALIALIISIVVLVVKKSKGSRKLPKTKNGKPVVKKDDDYSEELLRRMDEEDLMESHPREKSAPRFEEPVLQKKNASGEYENVDYGLDVTDRVAPQSLRTSSTDIPGITFAPDSSENPVNLTKEKFGVALGTGAIDEDGEEETTVLGKSPYLTRVSDGREIPLRDGFIIGKERKKVNYCITGNSSISRAHAQFRVIDGEFYVEDLQSKNYTTLNGLQLPAYKAAKLSNGDIIKMSDVEFTFHS